MAKRTSATLRLVGFLGLGTAILAGSLVGPAYADDQDNRNRQWNGSRHEHARQQARQQDRWREQHQYQEYYRQPNVYYSVPPVIYQLPGRSIYLSNPYFYN